MARSRSPKTQEELSQLKASLQYLWGLVTFLFTPIPSFSHLGIRTWSVFYQISPPWGPWLTMFVNFRHYKRFSAHPVYFLPESWNQPFLEGFLACFIAKNYLKTRSWTLRIFFTTRLHYFFAFSVDRIRKHAPCQKQI